MESPAFGTKSCHQIHTIRGKKRRCGNCVLAHLMCKQSSSESASDSPPPFMKLKGYGRHDIKLLPLLLWRYSATAPPFPLLENLYKFDIWCTLKERVPPHKNGQMAPGADLDKNYGVW
ncbi:hypothetical protein ACFE04_011118 [Oxalis oulophora]